MEPHSLSRVPHRGSSKIPSMSSTLMPDGEGHAGCGDSPHLTADMRRVAALTPQLCSSGAGGRQGQWQGKQGSRIIQCTTARGVVHI